MSKIGKMNVSPKSLYTPFTELLILIVIITFFFIFTSQVRELDLGKIFSTFLNASFGSVDNFGRALMKMTFIMVPALGLTIAFKCGAWNVGGEGQIALGAIAATGVSLFLPFNLPSILTIILIFITAFVLGGGYAAIAGYMREKWGVTEIVVTVMQSIIALALVNYLCSGPWKEPAGYIKRTPAIPADLALPSVLGLSAFFIIGLIMIPLVHMLINKTTLGYEMRVVGYNKKIAVPHKLNVTKLVILSMFISGGICGITGAGIVTGEIYRMQVGLTGNFGFYAIAALFMAREKAKYTIFSSFLLAVIYQGVLGLATLGIPRMLGDILIGITFIVAILPEIRLRLKR